MNKTSIEWCDATLNPVVGCTFGCEYCYARKMNQRFGWIKDFSNPQFFPERLKKLESKKPQVVFMNSLSDIADWEREWIYQTFNAAKQNKQHKYLFLTKRYDRFVDKVIESGAVANKVILRDKFCWIGLTVDIQQQLQINNCGADFLSIEPILRPIILSDANLYNVKWVIIGAETGNRKGKVVPEKAWIMDIVKVCDKNVVPVFMKDSLIPIVGEENMRREFPW